MSKQKKQEFWVDKQSFSHLSMKPKDQAHWCLIALDPKDKTGNYLFSAHEVLPDEISDTDRFEFMSVAGRFIIEREGLYRVSDHRSVMDYGSPRRAVDAAIRDGKK